VATDHLDWEKNYRLAVRSFKLAPAVRLGLGVRVRGSGSP